MTRWPGVIDAFRAELALLPAGAPALSLGEGNTPLVPARRAGRGADLWFKWEGANPTGSFKDRGMAVAVSGAMATGARGLLCASTGNTAASAAAYGARAGLPVTLAVPAGRVAQGKLAQAAAGGAQVLELEGGFDEALRAVRDAGSLRPDIAVVNSINPLRLEGQKTAAHEVVAQLGRAPDWLAIPVGNAGNITAYARGFFECREAGRAEAVPQLLGVQAAGAAPLVRGERVPSPETVATAIRIGDPASGPLAVAAVRQAGGRFLAVTDDEILAAYRFLAQEEGLFAEPASAASLAGLWRALDEGLVPVGATVVAVLTGHGLKDPERGLSLGEAPRACAATGAALAALLR
ncbi:MAG TPA: threonine synthase [Bacillota bacterium]|nr:threonine synthase [Bacillota bacterium]